MILKKPYAFFLRHYKLIHLILVFLAVYLAFKTINMFGFFNEYVKVLTYTVDRDAAPTLYGPGVFLSIFGIVVITTLGLILMRYKNKSIKFYALNAIGIVLTFFIITYSYTLVRTLESELLDVRTLRIVRDLLLMSSIYQGISIFICLIKVIIPPKSSNSLFEISSEDNGEFLFDVNLDSSKYKRNFKKNLRNFKYTYKENKTIINLLGFVLIGIICCIIYYSLNVYNRTYKVGETFTSSNFNFGVVKVYTTTKDYKGENIIDRNHFVIVKIKVKSIGNKAKKIDLARIKLSLGRASYFPTITYVNKFLDLGIVYTDEKINSNKFEEYLLVYDVKEELLNKSKYLKFYDYNNRTIKIKLKSTDVDHANKVYTSKISETMIFDKTDFKNTKFIINNYQLAYRFKIDYNFCVSVSECHTSYEYITPELNSNTDKILMKIDGSLVYDSKFNTKLKSDLASFIYYFGKIVYEISGKTYTSDIPNKEIKPTKSEQKDSYYIEVPKNIEKANNIRITFTLRDKIYKYTLKEGVTS